MFLNLKKGDQITLPSSIEIDGKTHSVVNIDSLKLQRYKGLNSILIDLSRIETSIQKYIQSRDEDQFISDWVEKRRLLKI